MSKSTLLIADLTSWEGWVHLAGAMRRQGFDVIRITGRQESRMQKLRVLVERSVFSETHCLLDAGSGAIDVSPLFPWLEDVADIQMVDAIGAELTATPQWRQAPGLRRVHAPGLDEAAAYDKWTYTQLAKQHGVPVPRSEQIRDSLPVGSWVVKGRIGSGGDRVASVTDLAELQAVLDQWGLRRDQAFVQEYVPGDLWNVGGVASHGDVLVAGAYRAWAAPDDPQGPPAEVELADRPDMLEATRQIVQALGYHGPFALDFIDAGAPYLLDVNPRFFGTWAALQSAGVDLLGAYLHTLGQPWRHVPLPLDTTIIPASVGGVRGMGESWQRAREFTDRTGSIIGGRATMAVTAAAMSGPLKRSERKPTIAMAYSEPWLAALQFSAALRQRDIHVRRCAPAPQTLLQRARQAGESVCFDSSQFVLRDDGRDLTITDPHAVVDDAADVQMTERVRDALLDTAAWKEAGALHVPDHVDERLLCDKELLHTWAAARGVRVPNRLDARAIPTQWPVITKPVTGYGGIGVKVCRDIGDLAFSQQTEPIIIEELLPGPQINVGGVALSGEVQLAVSYRPLPARAHPNGPPIAIEVTDSPEANAIAADLMAGLEYTGPFCLDLMYDSEGRLSLLDLNARIFGAWSGLQRAGADIIGAYLHALDLAPAPPPSSARVGEQVAVDVDPSVPVWRSWRDLTGSMRPITGYRGLVGQAAPVLAKFVHG